MVSKKVSKQLWGYGLVYQAEILSRITRGKIKQTGNEEVTGHTQDISEWIEFYFNEHMWCLDKNHPSTTDDNIILG